MSDGGGPGTGWVVPGYRHVSELGSGASGRVVHAVHEQTGRQVAVKYLAPALLADLRFVERFRVEARLLAGLTDPHLVRFFDYVESPYGAAIVMEFVPGATLRTVMNSRGPLPPEAALVLLKGSLLGLAAAHAAGVVHRDYKPENVLVLRDGTSKLADFGVAVPTGRKAELAGTPAYMAPEQWAAGTVSPSTDVYAATVVFFECVAGAKPYRGTTLEEWAAAHQRAPIPAVQVPAPLRGLVEHGMAKDPASRPASAAAFFTELESTARKAYGRRWEKRGRRALAALAAGVLSLLGRGLFDKLPADGGQGGQLTHLGKTVLGKPAVLIPVLTAGALFVTATLILVDPIDRIIARSEPTGRSAPATRSPDGEEDKSEPRRRMEEQGTANFRYEMQGCCSRAILARGRAEMWPSGTSAYLGTVYDGSDGSYTLDGERFVFHNPEVASLARKARAYAVGPAAYVNVDQGWRRYTEASAEYDGEQPDSIRTRYKTAARNAFNTRAAVSAQHIEALLRTSGHAEPKVRAEGRTVRGSSTTAAVIAEDRRLSAVYGELAENELDYTVVLAADVLPKRLDVKVYTPGGNSEYWQYTVTYSNWGAGDPIAPPGRRGDRTASGTPVPSATAATSRAP